MNAELERAYELADQILTETVERLQVAECWTANVKKTEIDRKVAPGFSIAWWTAKVKVRVTAIVSEIRDRQGRLLDRVETAKVTIYEMTEDGFRESSSYNV